MDKWQVPPICEEMASEDELKFVLEQAEKKIKEMTDDTTNWHSKGVVIIGFCIAFFTGIAGYLLSSSWSVHSWVGLAVELWLLAALFIMRDTLTPIKTRTLGSPPSNLMQEDLFTDLTIKSKEGDTTPATPLYFMLWKSIREAEEKIAISEKNNLLRSSAVGSALNLLYALPYLILAAYLIVLLACPQTLSRAE